MKSSRLVLLVCLLFIAGCSAPSITPDQTGATAASSDAAPPGEPTESPGIPSEVASLGPFATYQTPEYGFLIEVPANWEDVTGQSPNCNRAQKCFERNQTQVLTIEIGDLGDVGKPGMTTLEKYLDIVVPDLGATDPGFELIARAPFEIASGLPGEVIEFTFHDGLVKARRLWSVSDGKGINVTYITYADEYDRLNLLVDYSFSTLRMAEGD
jgi:hypothetical protein